MSAVIWTDVAPRDGLQNIAESVTIEAKLRLVRGLLGTGVDRVEATSFVAPSWVPQLIDAADVIDGIPAEERDRVRALVPNPRGLERALESGLRNVVFTIAATDAFNQRNVNRSVAESLAALELTLAAAAAAACRVDVTISVAFGCPFTGRVRPQSVAALAREIAERGVAEVTVADTIGVAAPDDVRRLCTLVAAGLPDCGLGLHVHDTRGMGVANVLAAYDAGVVRFEGSAGGVGGCPFAPRSTGNVCSEDALLALVGAGARIAADLEAYCAVSQQLAIDLDRDLPGKLYRAGLWQPDGG